MTLPFRTKRPAAARPLVLVAKPELPRWLRSASAADRKWVAGSRFAADAGEICLMPGRDGAPARALAGLGGEGDEPFWAAAAMAARVPEGVWALASEPPARLADRVALGWASGSYAFARYKKAKRAPAILVWPAHADRARATAAAEAATLVRDLVNTPAEDMGPAELAGAAQELAERHAMTCAVTVGDTLIDRNFPLIHAVGRASARAPRLIDLAWGDPTHLKVTVLGKGVCFDTGGLDLKPSSNMLLMKKDMGGAAHALGLAHMIAAAKLPVRLRVLVPAVENAVAGNAIRPLDVVRSRKGLTVEIGNTDAEGRLVLADALALASEDRPGLIIDFATLTGAARVALGPELPALFCNDEALAADLLRHAAAEADPCWRLPLWPGYRRRLDGKIADLNNVSDGPFAGSVTAALFMQEFVGKGIPWAHFDIFAWNAWARPGRPEGAEAQVLRAAFATVAERAARAAGPA